MKPGQTISIWLFIGVALVVNGALVMGAGLYELVHPPPNPVVLFHLHANVWWGGLLLLLGAVYCRRFAPGRQQQSSGGERPGAERGNPCQIRWPWA